MKKIYGLAWLLLLSAVITGQAQRIVQGTVQDASTKQGLPGITVSIKGTKTGVLTNMQGDFQLAILHDTIAIVFSWVGYETLEKKIIIMRDTTRLPTVRLKEDCNMDFFYSKNVELSFLNGLWYAPLGGKIKIFYPYLIHARHSQGALRAEFSYQFGNANYQRNGTLALDNAFINCDHNVDITTDYQGVRLGEQKFSYTRYTAGATYTGKLVQLVNREIPVYLAAGRLSYLAEGVSATKAGVEVGINYPFFIHFNSSRTNSLQIITTGRVAWWQDYWQFRGSVEIEKKQFTVGIGFNKLGQYAEINTRLGFKLQRRFRAKKNS